MLCWCREGDRGDLPTERFEAREQVLLAVARTFLGLQGIQQMMDAAREAESVALQREGEAKAQLGVGMTVEAALLRAQSETAQARVQLAQLSGQYAQLVALLGALVGEAGIPFWPIYFAAVAGGFLGDWLSYWVGDHYQQRVYGLWPFTRHPAMLERGHVFFARWGIAGVFLGRFFGPLRAVVPLVAGLCGMSRLGFQLANLLSAALWAFGLLAPGAFSLRWLARFVGQ